VPSNLPQLNSIRTPRFPPISSWKCWATPVVVPRDMPNTPLDGDKQDARLRPADHPGFARGGAQGRARLQARAKSLLPFRICPTSSIPDVLTTGEVNLMTKPVEEQTSGVEYRRAVRLDCVSLRGDPAHSIRPKFSLTIRRMRKSRGITSPIFICPSESIDKLLKAPVRAAAKTPQVRSIRACCAACSTPRVRRLPTRAGAAT
jgi:hypothetical protein